MRRYNTLNNVMKNYLTLDPYKLPDADFDENEMGSVADHDMKISEI
jgi:hypothetical protein